MRKCEAKKKVDEHFNKKGLWGNLISKSAEGEIFVSLLALSVFFFFPLLIELMQKISLICFCLYIISITRHSTSSREGS